MIRDQQKYFFPLQLLLDFTSTLIVYAVSAPLSFIFAGRQVPASPDFTILLPFAWGYYLNIAPLVFILPLLFLYLTNSYLYTGIKKMRWIIYSTGNASVITACFLLSLQMLYPAVSDARSFLTLFFPLSWLGFIINRLAIVRIVLQARNNSNLTKHLLLIGTDKDAKATAQLFEKNRDLGIKVTGFLTSSHDEVGTTIGSVPILGAVDDFADIIAGNVVDSVLFIGGITDITTIRTISLQCQTVGIDFGFSASVFSEKFTGITAEQLESLSAVFLKSLAYSPEKMFFKRFFDIAVAAALIVLFAPFWIIIPIWIRRTSPGPVFYSQERVGKHGRRFAMHKFRTMVVDADTMIDKVAHLNEMDGPVFKIKNDPRFTSIGQFLRQSSIDELPQLFNVLRGDMSLVGPRPPIMKEVLRYTPWQKKRLSVMPGITCLWQVTGRNEIKFDEWMQLDLQYIENWSLTLDFKILVRTITAVLLRRGAE
jgi:exopolysaccharide biosynthesis polyprenyl glycosylphosphotransferase